jgi:hypothetical protein
VNREDLLAMGILLPQNTPKNDTLAHSPNLPLSSSPGSESNLPYTIYTFYTAKVAVNREIEWTA